VEIGIWNLELGISNWNSRPSRLSSAIRWRKVFSMKAMPLVLICLSSLLSSTALSAETNRPNFDLVRQLNDAFVQVAETVSPAVVVLTVTEKQTVFAEPDALAEPEQHEYWRKHHGLFDDPPAQG